MSCSFNAFSASLEASEAAAHHFFAFPHAHSAAAPTSSYNPARFHNHKSRSHGAPPKSISQSPTKSLANHFTQLHIAAKVPFTSCPVIFRPSEKASILFIAFVTPETSISTFGRRLRALITFSADHNTNLAAHATTETAEFHAVATIFAPASPAFAIFSNIHANLALRLSQFLYIAIATVVNIVPTINTLFVIAKSDFANTLLASAERRNASDNKFEALARDMLAIAFLILTAVFAVIAID